MFFLQTDIYIYTINNSSTRREETDDGNGGVVRCVSGGERFSV